MTLILMARHSETNWNAERRVQGQSGASLNAKGISQARELGQLLRLNANVSAIVVSTLARALETGLIVAEALKLPRIYSDPRLLECSFGSLEGKPLTEVDELCDRYFADDGSYITYDYSRWGGEARQEVLARLNQCLGDVEDFFGKSASVILIGHSHAFCTLLVANSLAPERIKRQGIFSSYILKNARLHQLPIRR